MGLDLTGIDITTLEQRTEGWIAGLQLAALSLRQHDDAAAFIEGFAGDHRYIADYLVGEVLERSPADVRSFLLRTAVLERMSGPLCDAVTGQPGSHARLDALDSGNFFVVPLDDRRQWYRYHHLFAEVLRAYLAEEQADEVATLHRRAGDWFSQHGSLADAVRHYLAAGDVEQVADLAEQAAADLLRARQEATLLTWLRAVPDEVFGNRPVLSAVYAGALLACGQVGDVDSRLDAAESWLGPPELKPGRVVVDEATFRQLPGAIAMWRAGAALMRGDQAGTVGHAQRALELAAPDDRLTRGGAAGLLGLAALGAGDLEAAYAGYTRCVEYLRLEDHVSDIVGCFLTLADIRIVQGRLSDAMTIYTEGLQLAAPPGGRVLRGAADMYVGMTEIHRERGELDAARRQLARAEALGEGLGLPQNRYRSRVAGAHLLQDDGDLDGAAELLGQAEQLYDSDFSPKLRPVPAMRARLALDQERLDDALRWVGKQGLSSQDDLSFLREFEHVTLARVLIAKHRRDRPGFSGLREATVLLERLLEAAERGGRTGSVIEILTVQALALHADGDRPASLVPLGRALALAEPEGYLRVFLDAGLADLLAAAAQQGSAGHGVRRLLAAGREQASSAPSTHTLPSALSEREVAVLRLLDTDLSGPDIARELVVSLHTVRSHTKSIYAKLGVNSRRAAVQQAKDLAVLPPGTRRPG